MSALDSRVRFRLTGEIRTGTDFAWRVVTAKAGGLDRGVSRTQVVRVS